MIKTYKEIEELAVNKFNIYFHFLGKKETFTVLAQAYSTRKWFYSILSKKDVVFKSKIFFTKAKMKESLYKNIDELGFKEKIKITKKELNLLQTSEEELREIIQPICGKATYKFAGQYRGDNFYSISLNNKERSIFSGKHIKSISITKKFSGYQLIIAKDNYNGKIVGTYKVALNKHMSKELFEGYVYKSISKIKDNGKEIGLLLNVPDSVNGKNFEYFNLDGTKKLSFDEIPKELKFKHSIYSQGKRYFRLEYSGKKDYFDEEGNILIIEDYINL